MYNISKTACFTGKRMQYLPWKYNESDNRCVKLKILMRERIYDDITNGYTHFISGMALGVDTYAAEIVLDLKEQRPEITLEAALPCESQSDRWSNNDRERYFNILERCDKVTYISKSYTPTCLIERNRYMVDHSSRLIAVYNILNGGTAVTLKYAKLKNIDIAVINF